jgi:iron complex transport system ATP-binding protein
MKAWQEAQGGNEGKDARLGGSAVLLRTKGLEMRFGSAPVLKDVTLDFGAGEMVGLIGPNGAGKTTLLRLLLGLMKPTAGFIELVDKPLSSYRRRAVAQLMTLVPQDTQIGFSFTVEELIAMGRNPHLSRFQVPGSRDLWLIEQAMEATGVLQLRERDVATLSGGERQRVLIARAIAQETPVVLLDEVTSNLDLCHQLEILSLARGLARRGRLVMAAIHDLTLASRFCDRMILVAEGRIRADGPPRYVVTAEHLRQFFSIKARLEWVRTAEGSVVAVLDAVPAGPPNLAGG